MQNRRGPAAVTGDENHRGATVSFGTEWEGVVSRVTREPEDLSVQSRGGCESQQDHGKASAPAPLTKDKETGCNP